MIRRYRHLRVYRADCFFNGRMFTAVMPKKNEAWMALIEIITVEAKQ